MLQKTIPFLAFTLLLFLGCRTEKPPLKSFDAVPCPPAPDYSLIENWAAHPDKQDDADGVPTSQFHNHQEEAPADVFFIYPTIFFSDKAWNADTHDEKLNGQIASTTIRHQASIFNGACRVYAPRYRQMTYGGFRVPESRRREEYKALALAYEDVKAAFEYYLAHENNGRPLVVAGHSQGSLHAIRLIKEEIEGTPLMDRLVVAYIAGWPVKKDTFPTLPPCSTPDQTGCYASWCTYEAGFEPESPHFYQNAVCVNPITWKLDTVPSTEEQHLGVVMANYHKFYPEKLTAQVHGNILWASRPKVPLNWLVIGGHNFHIADFNLFWGNVRQNVEQRVATYLQAHAN